jgi:putative ABC transport system permease protein
VADLVADLRYALRGLARRPAFTAAAVLTLALGIGVNAAMFSVLDAALLRPLPYPDPDRLVSVLAMRPRGGPDPIGMTPADFIGWRDRSTCLAPFGAYLPVGSVALTGAGDAVRLERHLVSDGLLRALGVQAAAGRLFLPGEYRPGSRRVVVLSQRLWRGRFGGDPRVIGRRLRLDGELYEVIGVLPRGFRLPGGDPDLLLPLAFGPADAADRRAGALGGIARLRPGVSLAQARSELAAIAGALAQQFPASNRGLSASLVPLGELFTRKARAALWILSAAVLGVLLIACANAANLQLVRAVARQPEIELRIALGAGAARLAGQLFAETAVIAASGGVLGLLLGEAVLRLMPEARGVYLPPSTSVGLDGRVLGFAAGVTVASALLSGLAPVLRIVLESGRRGTRPGGGWRGLGPGLSGFRRGQARERTLDVLVVIEVAIACTLAIGAGLLLRSFHRLLDEPPGFSAAGVLAFDLALPEARYRERLQVAAFYRELVVRLESLPGVAAAAAATEIPPDEPWGFRPRIEGQDGGAVDEAIAGGAGEQAIAAGWQLVTPGYFAALRLPLLAGRPIAAGDRLGRGRVAVLGESAARRLLGSRDPLGRRVRFNGAAYEIVGVVGDVRPAGGGARVQPVVYFAHDQGTVPVERMRAMSVIVRTAGDPNPLARSVRRVLRAMDPDLPADRLEALERRLAAAALLARSRFNALLVAAFAALAAVLAAVGIYGVLSFAVQRRTREMGVRAALGARRADLVRLVLRRGLGLAAAGAAGGLIGACWLARLLGGLLTGERGGVAADAWIFAVAALGLTAVAAAASYLPARRASRVDPLAAVRQE